MSSPKIYVLGCSKTCAIWRVLVEQVEQVIEIYGSVSLCKLPTHRLGKELLQYQGDVDLKINKEELEYIISFLDLIIGRGFPNIMISTFSNIGIWENPRSMIELVLQISCY